MKHLMATLVGLALLAGAALAQPGLAPAPKTTAPVPADGVELLVCDGPTGNKLGEGWNNRFPGYTTVAFAFRDAKEDTDPNAKWPNFFYGRPTGEGHIVWNRVLPTGNFTVKAEAVVQGQGDQSRRIVGGLVTDGKFVPLSFEVKQFGTLVTETVKAKDRGGRDIDKVVEWYPVGAVLTAGERSIPVAARATVNFPAPGEGPDRDGMYINMTFDLYGASLGLLNAPADPIKARVSVVAFPKKKQ